MTAIKLTREEIQAEALDRARNGMSVANYARIYDGFTAKGIPGADIEPRVNVLTFNAWKAVGRYVRKGERGVKVVTFIDTKKDGEDGDKGGRRPWTSTVFHISQTDPIS